MTNTNLNTLLFVWALFAYHPTAMASDDTASEEVVYLIHGREIAWNSAQIGLTMNGQKDAAKVYAYSSEGKLEELHIKINLPDKQMDLVVPKDLFIGVDDLIISSMQVGGSFDYIQNGQIKKYQGLSVSFLYGEPRQNTDCEYGFAPNTYKMVGFSFDFESNQISRDMWGYCHPTDGHEAAFE